MVPDVPMERPDVANLQARPAVATDRTHQHRFALWHPQWGGYCAPCVVEFNSGESINRAPHDLESHHDLPCFEVYEFHDGEFPTEECQGARHYCCAEQVVRFGLDVMELQVGACDPPVSASLSFLEDARRRIAKLIDRRLHVENDPSKSSPGNRGLPAGGGVQTPAGGTGVFRPDQGRPNAARDADAGGSTPAPISTMGRSPSGDRGGSHRAGRTASGPENRGPEESGNGVGGASRLTTRRREETGTAQPDSRERPASTKDIR